MRVVVGRHPEDEVRMPNSEHMEILLQGVKAWNGWRAANPHIRASLGNASLRNPSFADDPYDAYLGGFDFRGADLTDADLGGILLARADFSGADLVGANLAMADLKDANLYEADLRLANLEDVVLCDAELAHATFGDTKIIRVDLSHTKGLDMAKHSFRSIIDVETLNLTAAGLSKYPYHQTEIEIFLLDAGVPAHYIEFFHRCCGEGMV